MTGVIVNLCSLVEPGETIREYINRWHDISGKLKLFHDQLGRLSDEYKVWETQITKFGLTDDEELVRKMRAAKSILAVEKSRLFGENDDGRVRCCSKIKLWLFPAELESSIQNVTTVYDDLRSSLKRKPEIESLFRERALQRCSTFTFKSDDRYIPLKRTQESVKTALKDCEGPPVILLYGRSGTGKSTLARHLALHFQNETGKRIEDHAFCSQPASTSGPGFDTVVYMECGPDVTLPAKQRELAEQLDPSASSTFADVQDKMITKFLTGLLKDRSLLIVLDDVWECQGGSSRGRPNFLQGMVSLGGERVKWLVTSQLQHICQHLNIRDPCCIGMEEVIPEDGRRILAALVGVEESTLIPEIKDIMDRIVAKTGGNLLAMTCVASTVVKKRCRQKKEWNLLESDLLKSLNTRAVIQMQGIGYGSSYWGAIRLGFERLSRAQKNLLILIHMCEGPSVSSDVVEYLFQHTLHQNWSDSESFSAARNALEGRQLLTVKTLTYPTLEEKERWSIHDLLRTFITQDVFKDLGGGVPIVDTLAKKEIMFEKGSTTQLEHEVLMCMASLYFGNSFGYEFTEKMAISSWTPKSAALGRKVIDPIAGLLGLTEDEEWTSALHHHISQVLLKYVKHGEFDEASTSSLLSSAESQIPILYSLLRSSDWNKENLSVGQQIIHSLFRLLESQITLVTQASANSVSARDRTLLNYTSFAFAIALSNSQDKINTSALNRECLQTVIKRLMLGFGGVEDN